MTLIIRAVSLASELDGETARPPMNWGRTGDQNASTAWSIGTQP
jgi:hypothetical protein